MARSRAMSSRASLVVCDSGQSGNGGASRPSQANGRTDDAPLLEKTTSTRPPSSGRNTASPLRPAQAARASRGTTSRASSPGDGCMYCTAASPAVQYMRRPSRPQDSPIAAGLPRVMRAASNRRNTARQRRAAGRGMVIMSGNSFGKRGKGRAGRASRRGPEGRKARSSERRPSIDGLLHGRSAASGRRRDRVGRTGKARRGPAKSSCVGRPVAEAGPVVAKLPPHLRDRPGLSLYLADTSCVRSPRIRSRATRRSRSE